MKNYKKRLNNAWTLTAVLITIFIIPFLLIIGIFKELIKAIKWV